MVKKSKSARRRKNVPEEDCNLDDEEMLSDDHTIFSETSLFSISDDFNEIAKEDSTEDAMAQKDYDSTSVEANQTKLLNALTASSIISSSRRTINREKCLQSLFKAITHADGTLGRETILSHLDEVILPACKSSLRGGIASPAEQYAACRVLEATSILLGGDMDEFCKTISANDFLPKVVKATGRAAQVRGAALRALACAYFVCGTDQQESDHIIDLCESVCAPSFRGELVSPSLRAIALDCWSLLSTTLHETGIAGVGDDHGVENGRGVSMLQLLSECLDHSNRELRCAAGECVAFIHEARLEMGLVHDDRIDNVNASERKFRRGSWDGTVFEVLMDEIKQRVAELSTESGYQMSKKAKREQRATFREFVDTIVEDESPNEVLTFRGGQVALDSWKEIIQLNFVRHCLQGGFQIQLMTNSTLQLIFGVESNVLNNNGAMSQIEKRLVMSKSSEYCKAADLEMTKKRRARTNAQNNFINAESEAF